MPKAVYTINLSNKDLSISGKPAAQVLKDANENRQGVKLTDKQIVRMQEVEKAFLENCLQFSMTKRKTLADIALLADISATIQDADKCFDIDEDDLKNYITDAIEPMLKKMADEKDPQRQAPAAWLRIGALLNQLKNPQKKATKNKK